MSEDVGKEYQKMLDELCPYLIKIGEINAKLEFSNIKSKVIRIILPPYYEDMLGEKQHFHQLEQALKNTGLDIQYHRGKNNDDICLQIL